MKSHYRTIIPADAVSHLFMASYGLVIEQLNNVPYMLFLNGVDDQKAVVEIFFQNGADFMPLQTAAPATGAGHYHA